MTNEYAELKQELQRLGVDVLQVMYADVLGMARSKYVLTTELEKGLGQFDMRVERDRNLKDKSIIGFFIYIEYFDKIIRKALSGQNPNEPVDEPQPEI